MNIEQKLEYIRKALEMGAIIDVGFHKIKDKSEAKKVAVELGKLGGMNHKHLSNNGTHWYKLRSEDYSLGTAIFFDEYLQEDVNLDGMRDEHVS